MPPKMTLYVGPTQEATWERARQVATETRRSLSQVVADALAAYIVDYDTTSGRLSDRDRAVREILQRAASDIERAIGGSANRTTKKTGRRTR